MDSNAGSLQSGGLVVTEPDSKFSKMGGIKFLGITTLIGIGAGVLTARSSAKKYKKYLDKGKLHTEVVMENPYWLAFRALGWGTLWAVGGVSFVTVCTCWFLGIKNMEDLRAKIRENKKPEDKSTNFENFQELMNYISTESKKSNSSSEESEIKS